MFDITDPRAVRIVVCSKYPGGGKSTTANTIGVLLKAHGFNVQMESGHEPQMTPLLNGVKPDDRPILINECNGESFL